MKGEAAQHRSNKGGKQQTHAFVYQGKRQCHSCQICFFMTPGLVRASAVARSPEWPEPPVPASPSFP